MAIKTITYVVEVNTANGKVKIDGITKGFQDASLAAKKLSNDISGLNKNLGQGIDKTGLAGAAVVELGRTISDSNYGITAMANNISQLSTLMVTLIATSGGVKKGFQAMWAALKGPLGLIVVFQIIVAAMERFAMKSKSAASGAHELGDAIAQAGVKLGTAIKKLNDINIPLEKKEKLLSAINKEYKDLNLKMGENNTLTQESLDKSADIIIELRKQAEVRAQLAILEDIYVKKSRLALINSIEQVGWLEKAWLYIVNGGKGVALGSALEARGKELAKSLNDGFEKEIADITAKIDPEQLEKMFGGKSGSGGGDRDKIKATDVIFGRNWRDDAKNELNVWREFFGPEGEITQATMATKIYVAEKENEIDAESYRKWLEWQQNRAQVLAAGQELLNAHFDLVVASFDRELVVEQNKTNALNNELRDRLRNENLSQEERRRIQLRISDNDEALRIRQEKIEKKRFKMQKAANIATATIETFLAAVKAYNQGGGGWTGIAVMVATIATGLAQVAKIASTKFETSASTAPSAGDLGGGGGGSSRSEINPNFNIVGNSNANQIRDAIQGQFNQPIKAYVVAKDVKSAGELERNTISSNTIG